MTINISRRRFAKRIAAAFPAAALLAAVPRMVHSQERAPRQPVHPHWDMLLNHAGNPEKHPEDWLKAWLATLVREPERRIPGLMLVGPQESGKTVLHRAFGSLFPTESYQATSDWTQHLASMMKGTRLLNVFEENEHHVIKHAHRHEQLIAEALSVKRSKSHWIETATYFHKAGATADGIWLKTLSLERMKRPMPTLELTKHLADEKDQFLQTLRECEMLASLQRVPVSYAYLLRKAA